jgi:hypothetical protein
MYRKFMMGFGGRNGEIERIFINHEPAGMEMEQNVLPSKILSMVVCLLSIPSRNIITRLSNSLDFGNQVQLHTKYKESTLGK